MKPFDPLAYCAHLSTDPGVYRMLDAGGQIIYVGKAKSLKKRVSSYFNRDHNDAKTRALVRQIANIEVTLTSSELEALLLEINIIKRYRPRYNVVFRDDKSYPYLYLSKTQNYARLTSVRNKPYKNGCYFGPYPSAFALKQTLLLLQKIFKVRSCTDTFFKHRKRPCLQYQIKRCSAPCVGYIGVEAYAEDIAAIERFLLGKSQALIKDLNKQMLLASEQMEFERAAQLRDQVHQLKQLSEQQACEVNQAIDVDVVVAEVRGKDVVVLVLTVRHGQVLGTKAHRPKGGYSESVNTVLPAFLSQYYGEGLGSFDPPKEIICAKTPADEWLVALFKEQFNRQLSRTVAPRGVRAKWVAMAQRNLENVLSEVGAQARPWLKPFTQMANLFNEEVVPTRIACLDISHSMGEATVGSCVVFEETGAQKSLYRRVNIKDVQAGDDYAAMGQAITRLFAEKYQSPETLPDWVLIDGGKGQVKVAQEAMAEVGLSDMVLIGISKGPKRKSGLETLWCGIDTPIQGVDPHNEAFLWLQQIRDEAHRFAISAHRKQRRKSRQGSVLTEVEGIGPAKAKRLLANFGSLAQIAKSDVADLIEQSQLSTDLAEKVLVFAQLKTGQNSN